MNRIKLEFIEAIRRGELWPWSKFELKIADEKLNNGDEVETLKRWYEQLLSINFLSNYLIKDDVREIIIHSEKHLQLVTLKGIIVERDWAIKEGINAQDLQLCMEIQAIKARCEWNYSMPFQSFFTQVLGLNVRMGLTHFSLANLGLEDGSSKMFIRKVQEVLLPLDAFGVNPTTQGELIKLFKEKKNILIAGATGSGKTTLLSSLLGQTADLEHVVVLEDTHEILLDRDNFTYLTAQGEMRKLVDLCAYALRIRPDRVVLGEMRSTEVVPFVLSMNTGHQGLMSTVHANSAKDALYRVAFLFTLFSGVKNMDFNLALKLVCQNLEFVIFVKGYRVLEVVRVLGSEGPLVYVENAEILPSLAS